MRNLRIILLYVAIFLGALSLGEAAGGVKARPARTTRGKPKVPLGSMEGRRAAKSRSVGGGLHRILPGGHLIIWMYV
jgi:hypothetical protein